MNQNRNVQKYIILDKIIISLFFIIMEKLNDIKNVINKLDAINISLEKKLLKCKKHNDILNKQMYEVIDIYRQICNDLN